MKVWSAIFNLFAVVLMAFLLILFYRTEEVNTQQFEELRLRYAVDYATEAAFSRVVRSGDLGMDYVDIDNVEIGPGLALDAFKSIICLNYDMSMSRENMMHIENFIPTGVLFTRNGYYILELSETDSTPKGVALGGDGVTGGEWSLKWSVKYPYKVDGANIGSSKDEVTNRIYSISLNPVKDEEWTAVEKGTGLISDGKAYNTGTELYQPIGLTAQKAKFEITKLIMDDINYAINNRNYYNTTHKKMGTFYLPVTSEAKASINNVRRPTLIMFMQGVDFAGGNSVDTSSVGGVMAVRKRVVIGFRDTVSNINYYCYEKQLSKLQVEFPGRYKPEEMLDSIEEAAIKNYKPHILALTYELDDKNILDGF